LECGAGSVVCRFFSARPPGTFFIPFFIHTVKKVMHLKVMEFAADLKYFWNDGFGFEENHEQACRLSQHMMNHLSSQDHQSVFFSLN